MVVFYHGSLSVHWVSSKSISNLYCLLSLIILNNITRWNTEWRKKLVITLFNSCLLSKWHVTVLSQFFHLMQIALAFQPPSFQILIKNIWNTFKNEWKRILSPFAWKYACCKIPLNENHSISLSIHFGQWYTWAIYRRYANTKIVLIFVRFLVTWSIPRRLLQYHSLVHGETIPTLLEYDQFVM